MGLAHLRPSRAHVSLEKRVGGSAEQSNLQHNTDMGNRVKQPNGLLARFSDVVDDFTHMNMTVEQAIDVCLDDMGRRDAKQKVQRGLDDEKPWTHGVKGSGLDRWNDCLGTLKMHAEPFDDEEPNEGNKRWQAILEDRIAHGTMENPTEMYLPGDPDEESDGANEPQSNS